MGGNSWCMAPAQGSGRTADTAAGLVPAMAGSWWRVGYSYWLGMAQRPKPSAQRSTWSWSITVVLEASSTQPLKPALSAQKQSQTTSSRLWPSIPRKTALGPVVPKQKNIPRPSVLLSTVLHSASCHSIGHPADVASMILFGASAVSPK